MSFTERNIEENKNKDIINWLSFEKILVMNYSVKSKNKFPVRPSFCYSIFDNDKKIFCVGKVLPMLTSEIAICLGIYVGICCV